MRELLVDPEQPRILLLETHRSKHLLASSFPHLLGHDRIIK
jgi:hypothetical protein